MTPYYEDGRVVLYVGHVLDVLAQMEPGSVQCTVTSPPYFGLRAYGTDPQVWGGAPECVHAFDDTLGAPVITGGLTPKQITNAGSYTGNSPSDKSTLRGNGHVGGGPKLHSEGAVGRYQPAATCTRCGAWRGELGSEPLPDCLAWARGVEPCSVCFVCHLLVVFRAVRRVLHDSGTVFCNLGDSYTSGGRASYDKTATAYSTSEREHPAAGNARPPDALGLGPKQLLMMPARVALALQADGWTLRQQIIWAKPNPMPESVTDRCTTSHEYVYLLAKNPRYYFDSDAIKKPLSPKTLTVHTTPRKGNGTESTGEKLNLWMEEHGGRYHPAAANRRSVWTIPTESYPGSHFATFPRKLVEPCVLAGTSARGQCPRCGAPYERQTERDRVGVRNTSAGSNGQQVHRNGASHTLAAIPAQTTGWAPTCACAVGDPVPQTVLDPFAGSGTTLAVARWHQRQAIGIELNADYAALVQKRLAQGVLL